MAVNLHRVLDLVNSCLLVIGSRERAEFIHEPHFDPSVSLGSVCAFLDDDGGAWVADVIVYHGSFEEPPSQDAVNQRKVEGGDIMVAREVVRRAMLAWIDERFETVYVDEMFSEAWVDVSPSVALVPARCVALRSLRDPDADYYERWHRALFRPYLSMDQLGLARAVAFGFCNGFYVAREADEIAFAEIGLRVDGRRYWTPPYTRIREAVREITDDAVLAARVALERTLERE